ncbi:hypothetical protein K435DRAFT_965481 [Dendrothele bispora CBS 962.96]|uniref:Uncharacterized protein n=1 Tax=Dendrothele bispora (strain CBS 962.96) TaxID=1314807 RepID=A0A4S8M5G7_DENBC|nr:hypothetical protein K435DRAFT_965481 [Dendrothele bispora CBS 962.96]
MPPVRNQLHRRQRAVRVPVRDHHEEDVEMAFVGPFNIEAQNVHREVVDRQQDHARHWPLVHIFMRLLNFLADHVPTTCAQRFMNTNA